MGACWQAVVRIKPCACGMWAQAFVFRCYKVIHNVYEQLHSRHKEICSPVGETMARFAFGIPRRGSVAVFCGNTPTTCVHWLFIPQRNCWRVAAKTKLFAFGIRSVAHV